jgi:hypothetical protein
VRIIPLTTFQQDLKIGPTLIILTAKHVLPVSGFGTLQFYANGKHFASMRIHPKVDAIDAAESAAKPLFTVFTTTLPYEENSHVSKP